MAVDNAQASAGEAFIIPKTEVFAFDKDGDLALDNTQAGKVLAVDKDGDLTDWTHAAISKED